MGLVNACPHSTSQTPLHPGAPAPGHLRAPDRGGATAAAPQDGEATRRRAPPPRRLRGGGVPDADLRGGSRAAPPAPGLADATCEHPAMRTSLRPPGARAQLPTGLAEDLAVAPCSRASSQGLCPRAGPSPCCSAPSRGKAGVRYLHALQDGGSVLQDLGRQDHLGRFRLQLGRRSPRASSGHFRLHFLLKHKAAAGSAHSPHRGLPEASRTDMPPACGVTAGTRKHPSTSRPRPTRPARLRCPTPKATVTRPRTCAPACPGRPGHP